MAVNATILLPVNHDWVFELRSWKFGVIEVQIWGSTMSKVYLGPLSFSTELSAPAIATIAGGVAFAIFISIAVIARKTALQTGR